METNLQFQLCIILFPYIELLFHKSNQTNNINPVESVQLYLGVYLWYNKLLILCSVLTVGKLDP